MLIEFRVSNFRSISKEQTLSLVANKDKVFAETNLMDSGIVSVPHVLRSVAMYGPNAGGKSNLIAAMVFMINVVANSAAKMREGDLFQYQPFKLDPKYTKLPSEFEITFLSDGVRYQYGFSLTAERVIEEWLLVYKSYKRAKSQQWFTRKFNKESEQYDYNFSTHLTGQRKIWQSATRDNALFLSTAVQLNSEILRPVYLWIAENIMVIGPGLQPVNDFSIDKIKHEEGKLSVLNFLNAADISINDMSVEQQKTQEAKFKFNLSKREDPSTSIRELGEHEKNIVRFHHYSDKGSAIFDFKDESTGTQKLFAYAGPVIDVLKKGRVLIVDELDGSLHPHIMRFFINLFHSPDISDNNAQLIFSTHDTSLLDANIFRRDQIWFVEKNSSQATVIYPLTDFSPRKKEALERGYLKGRYGALPFLSDFHA